MGQGSIASAQIKCEEQEKLPLMFRAAEIDFNYADGIDEQTKAKFNQTAAAAHELMLHSPELMESLKSGKTPKRVVLTKVIEGVTKSSRSQKTEGNETDVFVIFPKSTLGVPGLYTPSTKLFPRN